MPEIKHNFTAGKMNKDLDKRLIPNGEYRDAMNIQVSTSEDGGVGTVQNILGNSLINNPITLTVNAVCIASIADEKNDTIYYFIHDDTKDYILQHIKNLSLKPVFVDTTGDVLGFSNNPITGINIIDNLLFWTDGKTEPKKINIDRCIDGTDIAGATHTRLFVDGNDIRDIEEKDITVIKQAPKTPLNLNYNYFRDPALTHTGIMTISDSGATPSSFINSSKGNVFDFSTLSIGDNFITIIETDIDGTDQFNLSWEVGSKVVLKEFTQGGNPPSIPIDNFTIKGFITNWEYNEFSNTVLDLLEYSFTNSFTINLNDWVQVGITNEFYFDASNGTNDKLGITTWNGSSGQKIKSGRKYRVSFELDTYSGLLQGKLKCRLFNNIETPNLEEAYIFKEFDDLVNGDANSYTFDIDDSGVPSLFNTVDGGGQPYANHVIFETQTATGGAVFQGTVKNVKIERIDNILSKVEIEISSIQGIPPTPLAPDIQLNYAIDIFSEDESLFESKLPRFSYRYKYEDDEYSTFAPFTSVTFTPGNFNYDSVQGYNKGMTNVIKNINIEDINYNKPDGVVTIDILYKEEGSTSVYVVDTLKNNENNYKITKETINGVVPTNQSLRLWDNVPRFALSQEIIGNRIVYGNYIQNYDLNNYVLELDAKITSTNHATSQGLPSVKSLREYQLGVVYTDKYGRETPVLTNSSSTVKLEKLASDEINEFIVRVKNDGHPINMKYFKFYVKDTGGVYYNMAMDRYYDAEDGNIWLAFPSTDRNKVEIDDFIILKKGINTNELIQDQAKYKILDIKNEAPDHIKKNEALLTKKHHSFSNPIFDDIPTFGGNTFSVLKSRYSAAQSQHLQRLPDLFNTLPLGVEYHIVFNSNTSNRVSQRYKVLNLELGANSANWYFSVKGTFGSDVAQFSDDPDNNNGGATLIIDNTYFSIFKTTVTNSPKFDGRFFVKILPDADFKLVRTQVDSVNVEYITSANASKKIYYCESNDATDTNFPLHHGGNYTGDTWGQSSGYNGWDTLTNAGQFQLGGSATTSIQTGGTQIGNLNHYIKARQNVIQEVGDWDYDSSPADSTYHSPKHHTRNQLAWKAYFRGINTETLPTYSMVDRVTELDVEVDRENNKFEDVWFISNIINSTDFANNEYEVSNSSPTQNSDTSGVTEWTGSDAFGLTNYSSTSVLELGFGGIEPNAWQQDSAVTRPDQDPSFFDIGNTNLNYASTQSAFVNHLTVGSQFRFKEDPTNEIYTINDVSKFYRIVYDNIEEESAAGSNNGNQYIGQINALNGDVAATASYFNIEFQEPTTSNNIGYRSSTFLDASNFFLSYQLYLDKPITWNPVETVGGAVSGGKVITILGATANPVVTKNNGEAYIEVDTISGVEDVSGEARSIEKGMVLDSYVDASDGTTVSMISNKQPIVYDINYDDSSGKYTIFLKSYTGGSDDLDDGSSAGMLGHIAVADNLIFKQYSMNGLSPNSAKNLNYFRSGGVSESKTGVYALGYTIEFIEQKPSTADNEVLPSNPAVWEIEPKENKDLDIYYEASEAYQIIEDASELQNFVPVGSKIEHVSSNAVPPGTTITAIDNAGKITLSNPAEVERVARPDQINRFR